MGGGTQISDGRDSTSRAATAGSSHSLSTEAVFETLSNCRRRYALHYLIQMDDPVKIRELSNQIAAWENRIEREIVSPKERKRVYTALHQTHLPMMERLGVVVYDKEHRTVTLTDRIRESDIYLDVVSRSDIPWSQFYLGLGGTLTALVTVAALGIPPFSYVGGFEYALFVALTFTVAGGVHTLRDRRKVLGKAATPVDVVPPWELAEIEEST